jgi:hypothetical protein
VRAAVWVEVQDRVRGPGAIPRGESEPVTYNVVDGSGRLVRRFRRPSPEDSGCRLCPCPHDAHSEVLPLKPCLDCDCPGWT